MSSYDPYEQLYGLDRSSSGFHDQISNILYGGEYRKGVPNLEYHDLARLVDFLDEVRCHMSHVMSRFFAPRST